MPTRVPSAPAEGPDSGAEGSVHSHHSVSSLSQRFIPKEDDPETLWEVIAILAEKARMYKVQWAGEDPKTMKPWPPQWVPKQDVTDDLVVEWKRKKRERERKRKSTSKRPHDSTTSRKSTSSTVRPAASRTNTSSRSRSRATVSPAKQLQPRGSSSSKLKHEAIDEPSHELPEPPQQQEQDMHDHEDFAPKPAPPASPSQSPTRQQNTTVTQGTSKKRKLADAQSTHTSANSAPVLPAAAAGTTLKLKGGEVVHTRPKKKRKVEVEVLKPNLKPRPDLEDLESEEEMSTRGVSDARLKNKDKGKGKTKQENDNEEERVRVIYSPSPHKSLTRYDARVQSQSQSQSQSQPQSQGQAETPTHPHPPIQTQTETQSFEPKPIQLQRRRPIYAESSSETDEDADPGPIPPRKKRPPSPGEEAGEKPDPDSEAGAVVVGEGEGEDEDEEDARMVEDQLSQGIHSPPPTFEVLPDHDPDHVEEVVDEVEAGATQDEIAPTEDEHKDGLLIKGEQRIKRRRVEVESRPPPPSAPAPVSAPPIGRKTASNQLHPRKIQTHTQIQTQIQNQAKDKGKRRAVVSDDEDEEDSEVEVDELAPQKEVDDEKGSSVSENGSSEGEVEVVAVKKLKAGSKPAAKIKTKANGKTQPQPQPQLKGKSKDEVDDDDDDVKSKPKLKRRRKSNPSSSSTTATTSTATANTTVKKPAVTIPSSVAITSTSAKPTKPTKPTKSTKPSNFKPATLNPSKPNPPRSVVAPRSKSPSRSPSRAGSASRSEPARSGDDGSEREREREEDREDEKKEDREQDKEESPPPASEKVGLPGKRKSFGAGSVSASVTASRGGSESARPSKVWFKERGRPPAPVPVPSRAGSAATAASASNRTRGSRHSATPHVQHGHGSQSQGREYDPPEEEQSVFYTPSSPAPPALSDPAEAQAHAEADQGDEELIPEPYVDFGPEQGKHPYQLQTGQFQLQKEPQILAAQAQNQDDQEEYEGDGPTLIDAYSQSQSLVRPYNSDPPEVRVQKFGVEGAPLWPGHLPASLSLVFAGHGSSAQAKEKEKDTARPPLLLSPQAVKRLEEWDREVMWAEDGPGPEHALPQKDSGKDTEEELRFVPIDGSALFVRPGVVANAVAGSSSGIRQEPQQQEVVAPFAKPKSTVSASVSAAAATTASSSSNKPTSSKSASKAAPRASAGPATLTARAAAAAKSPPPPPLLLPPHPQSSFDTEIVPETEPESNANSQSQSLPAQSQVVAPTAVPVQLPPTATSPPPQPAVTHAHPEPPRTPPRPKPSTLTRQGSLKSRMKPRTPGTNGAYAADTYNHRALELHPLPMLSPTVFIPHLNSSLGESVIEEADEDEEFKGRGPEEESIEEFESPVRRKNKDKQEVSGGGKKAEKEKKRVDEGDESTDQERQEESEVEFAWREKLREIDEQSSIDAPAAAPPQQQQQIPEQDQSKDGRVGNSGKRSTSRSSLAGSTGVSRASVKQNAVKQASTPAGVDVDVDYASDNEDEDEEMRDASTAVVPPASGPRDMDVDVNADAHAIPDADTSQEVDQHPAEVEEAHKPIQKHDSNLILQQMEEAYVDLSGGDVSPRLSRPVNPRSDSNAAAGPSTSTTDTHHPNPNPKPAAAHDEDDLTDDESREVGSAKANRVRDPVLLRQEEEESTQDVLMDLRAAQQFQEQWRGIDRKDLEVGWDFGIGVGVGSSTTGSGGAPNSARGQEAAAAAEPVDKEQEQDRGSERGSEKGSDKGSTSSKKGKGKAKPAAEVAPLPTIAEDEAMAMNVDHDEDHLDVPQITIQQPSRAASARPYSVSPTEEESGQGIRSKLRSRSRSATPAPAPAVTPKKGAKRAGSKAPSRAGSLAPTPAPAPPLPAPAALPELSVVTTAEPEAAAADSGAKQASMPPVDLEAQRKQQLNLVLVASQAEQIARLEAQLASERAKNEGLQQEVLALQPRLVHPNQLEPSPEQLQQQHQESTEVLAEAKRYILQLEEEHTAHLAQKGEWEIAQKKFMSELEAEARRKVDAEKDRDFFREQYAQASGFVGQVRDENKDLEKRVAIAEEQAKTGVAGVKMMFEARVKMLEEDLKAWRQTAQFMIEKDKRTNDEIRRRAAEEPELRARCARQEVALEVVGERMEELEEEVKEKKEALETAEREMEELKKETTRLHIELSEAKTKLERIARAAGSGNDSFSQSQDIGDDESGVGGHGSEFVYCCQWRSSDGNGNITACKEVFSTISELEQHLFTGGHLQPS